VATKKKQVFARLTPGHRSDDQTKLNEKPAKTRKTVFPKKKIGPTGFRFSRRSFSSSAGKKKNHGRAFEWGYAAFGGSERRRSQK
jgi:hypothetical protein